MLTKRLKELRNEKDILQKDVANYLNITTSAYGFYEQGKRTPDSETLTKLANFFEVSVDYLLGRTNIKNNNPLDKDITLALHSEYDYDDLPEEARKEISNFIKYMRDKYKDK